MAEWLKAPLLLKKAAYLSRGIEGSRSLRSRHPFSYNIVFIGVSTSTHMSTHNPPPLFGAEIGMNVFGLGHFGIKGFSRC